MTLPRDLAVSRGSRDDASIVPYMGCGGAGFAVGRRVSQAHNVRPYMGCGGAGFPRSVGAGFIPPAGVCAAAGCGGMRASRPTAARAAAAVPVGPIRKNIRRGGIYCARRRVSEANRRAAAALRPEIPPAGICGGAGFPLCRGVCLVL